MLNSQVQFLLLAFLHQLVEARRHPVDQILKVRSQLLVSDTRNDSVSVRSHVLSHLSYLGPKVLNQIQVEELVRPLEILVPLRNFVENSKFHRVRILDQVRRQKAVHSRGGVEPRLVVRQLQIQELLQQADG